MHKNAPLFIDTHFYDVTPEMLDADCKHWSFSVPDTVKSVLLDMWLYRRADPATWLPPITANVLRNKRLSVADFWSSIFIATSPNNIDSAAAYFLSAQHLHLLAAIVLRVLALPSSSASAERVFSRCQFLKTSRRNRMKPETLNELAVLGFNALAKRKVQGADGMVDDQDQPSEDADETDEDRGDDAYDWDAAPEWGASERPGAPPSALDAPSIALPNETIATPSLPPSLSVPTPNLPPTQESPPGCARNVPGVPLSGTNATACTGFHINVVRSNVIVAHNPSVVVGRPSGNPDDQETPPLSLSSL